MIRYELVYQCGIANVFKVHIQDSAPGETCMIRRERVLQGAYRDCETFCRGVMSAMDNPEAVSVWHSDMAGDLDNPYYPAWQEGPGTMFEDKKHPPACATYAGR